MKVLNVLFRKLLSWDTFYLTALEFETTKIKLLCAYLVLDSNPTRMIHLHMNTCIALKLKKY